MILWEVKDIMEMLLSQVSVPILGVVFKGDEGNFLLSHVAAEIGSPWGDDIRGDSSRMTLPCITHLMHSSLALIYTSAQ